MPSIFWGGSGCWELGCLVSAGCWGLDKDFDGGLGGGWSEWLTWRPSRPGPSRDKGKTEGNRRGEIPSPVPKGEGPGAPEGWLGSREWGHPAWGGRYKRQPQVPRLRRADARLRSG